MRQLLLLYLILLCSPLLAQERYSKVRIPLSSPEELRNLSRLGIALDHVGGRPGRWIDAFLSASEVEKLDRAAVPYSVLIPDWKEFYAKRQMAEKESPAAAPQASPVSHFHYGSMGGFLTLEEVKAELDSMHSLYPTLISARDSIGASVEGRPLWAVKISRNPSVDLNEPRVLYTALHHAREPGSMMALIYTMWYLLENDGTDAEVTDLLNHRELYFIPVVNPDGYAYNISTNPSGGGMWRKNRRINGDGSMGVDLNRNYGFKWGYDNVGSTGNGSNETYRGSSGFSEPETKAIRDFCAARGFAMALNYHTYGNLLIYPWGYTDTDTGDSAAYRRLADGMTAVNRYSFGTGSQTVGYITNGDSDDWMFGDTTSKPRVFAMTPEVGTESDGFWPPAGRILPVNQENLRANLYCAHAAGEYIAPASVEVTYPKTGDPIRIGLSFVNKGTSGSSSTVDLSVRSEEIEIMDSAFTGIAWQNSLTISARPGAKSNTGQSVRVFLTTTSQGGTAFDTLRFHLGPASVLYADDAESTRAHWVSATNLSTGWDTTRARAHSGTHSFADSPPGYYPDNVSTTFTLDSSFTLSGSAAELRFWGTWDIETNYDYARAEISADGGTSWTPLIGKYTSQGSGVSMQTPAGSPGYGGTRHDWVEEVIDLGEYLSGGGKKFRFRFESDGSVTREGIFIDDISLLLFPFATLAVAPESLPGQFVLRQNYPNPFNPSTSIGYQLSTTGQVSLKVFDLLGREVATLVDERKTAGTYAVSFNGSGLASGVYFYRLIAGASVQTRGMLLLK